jgi:hypothetical protein
MFGLGEAEVILAFDTVWSLIQVLDGNGDAE